VSPASVAPADGSFRGRAKSPLPLVTFRWNTPPSVGRSKDGEVPPASPSALFARSGRYYVALHEDADRAMVAESWPNLTATDPQMRLLIIEDDRESADYLVKAFREVGYVADLAGDGEEGLALADGGDYDVLVIDRMLPKRDGLSLIGTLREKGNHTPALILSALGQVDDRIKGLRAGGDDYLPKPYSFAELLARVEVLSRRHGGPTEETTYRVGDLELDRLSHRVARGKDELTLQPREFRLLEYLMKHAGQVVTRTMLLENVWDYHFDPQTNVIDVHISRLRSKIDKGFERPLLHTIRGAGYMIRDGIR
jgi:two-component system, OmpR family, response regulator